MLSCVARLSSSRLAGSSRGYLLRNFSSLPSIESSNVEDRVCTLRWSDGFVGRFHNVWLRDNCKCPRCYNSMTNQRIADTLEIPLDIVPSLTEIKGNSIVIQWPGYGTTEEHQSVMCSDTLRNQCYWTDTPEKRKRWEKCVPQVEWTAAEMGAALVEHDYAAVTDDGDGSDADTLGYGHSHESAAARRAREDLARYGMMVVKGMPNTNEGVARVASRLGFVRETLYGRFWATAVDENSEAVFDTAYTSDELLPHTDGTYMTDPPGLQLFNCVAQASVGGESRFVDGFKVAQLLKEQDPEAFDFFCSTPLVHHCHDVQTLLQGCGPVFELDSAGRVCAMRYNDYDRSTVDHLHPRDVEAFYRHHKSLAALIRDPELSLRVRTEPGTMVVLENYRVMHGRYAFSGGNRKMIGCYMERDEYESRLRFDGLRAPMSEFGVASS